VAKVAQSATATWSKSCHISKKVGPRTVFKLIFFCRDVIQTFFYRDENQNTLKL